MLERIIQKTKDGSPTLHLPEWNESYHSKHGAVQEALHVFIDNGLAHFDHLDQIHVLEFGFGTGLNALLTLLYAHETNKKIHYTTLEKFPLGIEEISPLHFETYISRFRKEIKSLAIYEYFLKMHNIRWSEFQEITKNFYLKKLQIDFNDFQSRPSRFDVVYFDAFGKRVQPELWTESIFMNIFDALHPNGLLTTYACNGSTVRALKNCKFEVEKKPGPPGKREMINAWKK